MAPSPVNYASSTALVTGGSSGIGQAIAAELIKRGVKKLVIVAHSQEKMDKASEELKQAGEGVEIRTISVDLASHEAASEVESKVKEWGWQVDILVNNAGLARKQAFASQGPNNVSLRTVDVMIRTVVDLSLRFLPPMLERKEGGVLNVCSTACYQPVPFTAMYAASKAFMLSWSQSVREENIESGVRFAAIVPGITSTNLDGDGHGERRGPILDAVGIDEPETVAKAALDAYEENAAQKVVGWNNYIATTVTGMIPDSVKAAFIHKTRGEPEMTDDVGARGECCQGAVGVEGAKGFADTPFVCCCM